MEEEQVSLGESCTVMEHQVDSATQTDPVVVLSLAQAAVLGLISQNQVFGATIAPNGFYTDEAKEGTIPPTGGYEDYADHLIGANGDYLAEPGDGADELTPGPRGRSRRILNEHDAVEPGKSLAAATVKGEEDEGLPLTSCLHRLQGLVEEINPSTYRVTPKEEPPGNCCSSYDSGEVLEVPLKVEAEGMEPPLENGFLKSEEQREGSHLSHYFDPVEVGLEGGDASVQVEFDDSGQDIAWPEPVDSEGQSGRRVQIDRLDINVQIDESYCVDVGEGLRRWKCRMCEKSYTSKYNLVTHILGHSGIKPHECPRCGKLFKQPSHLQTHLLTHQGTRPHKCAVCKKAFTQTSHLKRHMLQHTDIKPYSCRFCGRGFAYPSELRAHETKHESGSCHVCSQCGLELPSQAHLKRHQAAHQGPAPFQCPRCTRSFAYRSQLQSHLLKHDNARPFVCTECGLEFVQLHHLKQHMLTHKVQTQQTFQSKGIKEFKCEVCSRGFTLSANLKRHMLIHTSVRPFQCHVCFKTFVQKQTLKTHMIVHLPVKPFKCKVCGKSFNRMYNLLGHMHLHAGSKPFKCPYCSSKFNLKGNLSRHMKVKHGIADTSFDRQDSHPRVDTQEGYQENFDFTEQENMASSNGQDVTKLAEAAMDFYSFGKEEAQYSAL